MHVIENLKLEKGILSVQGYNEIPDCEFIVKHRNKVIFKEKMNINRPDIQSFITDYKSNSNYGFDFKVDCSYKKFSIYLDNTRIYKTNNYYIRKKLSSYKKIIKYIKNSIKILWNDYHFLVPINKWKEFVYLFYKKVIKKELLSKPYYEPFSIDDYNNWIVEKEKVERIFKFKYNPKISLVMPVYNVEPNLLEACLESILNQTYKNFEICIADDNSSKKETLEKLKEYEEKYHDVIKVVYRKKNGHISEATNSALKLVTGEFIGLIDNDDVLAYNALYENVKALNADRNIDFLYSDEDKLNLEGKRCEPHFKPDFSLDTLYSHNYICHFAVIRTSLIKKVKGFRKGYEGSQDYDLFLRISEITKNIYHIPKILYHWRMIPGSTSMETNNKSYACKSGVKALENMMIRRNIKGKIESYYTSYIINYTPPIDALVSIIIPTRDKVNILENCIGSIIEKTAYKNYEIIIVDNGSKEKETFNYFRVISKKNNVKILKIDEPFNYSMLNNRAVKISNGDYICMLNNDIEIINPNWLNIMLGYASQKHIGAVGPKLLFENKKIQHAGVILGTGDGKIATHAYYLEDRNAPAVAGRLIVPYNYSAVTGACIVVSKDKYLEVNGLDEKLAVNYNDVDFCMKLLDKGYNNVFLPQVELYHLESISRGKINNEKKAKQLSKEQNYMRKKWKDKLLNDKYYNKNYSKMYLFKLEKDGDSNEKSNKK